jgi:hypothetical protein
MKNSFAGGVRDVFELHGGDRNAAALATPRSLIPVFGDETMERTVRPRMRTAM